MLSMLCYVIYVMSSRLCYLRSAIDVMSCRVIYVMLSMLCHVMLPMFCMLCDIC